MGTFLSVILVVIMVGGGGIALFLYITGHKSAKDSSTAPARRGTRFSDLPHATELASIGFQARMDFYIKGMDQGFNLRELRLLMKLVRTLGIREPASILGSTSTLDKSLRRMMDGTWRRIIEDHDDLKDLVFRLLEYRMQVEMNRPRNQKGMDSTRTVKSGQIMKMLLPEKILLMGKVTDIGRTFLKLQVVQGKLPVGYNYKGRRAEIWFWRADDAMYQFETEILSEPEKNAVNPELSLRHSDRLVRQQKRSSLRGRVQRDGEIMPVPGLEQANETYQPGQGYQCRIMDISENGAAVVIRGKISAGVYVKIQLPVDEGAIVMCGEVKSLDIKPNYGVTVLHMEALPLSKWMRALVMAYVLGFVSYGTEPVPEKIEADAGDTVAGPDDLGFSKSAMGDALDFPFTVPNSVQEGGRSHDLGLPEEE